MFIEPALAAGALGFSAYIPASLEIVIDENGAVHVPTGDAAKIFNNVKTKDICVTDISVTAKNDWFPANWIAGFDTMADNAKFFGLRMRGDTMQADGSFSLTPDSWVIKSNSSIDLGIEVRLPAQTAARQEVIGEISFTLDWAKGSNPDDGKHTISFVPGKHGIVDDTTPVKTDEDGIILELPSVTPDDGYEFDHWEDQDGNPVKPGDKLDDDTTLKPVFSKDGSHSIGFIPGDHGTIDDNTSVRTDKDGTVPELPAVIPDDGYVFDHWEDQDGNPVEPGDKLDDDATLKPVFREDGSQPEDTSHTVGFVPGEHGTIDDDSPIKTDPDGVVPELPTVTPDDGYAFDHWEDQNGNPVKSGDKLNDDAILKPVFKEDGSQPEDTSHTVNFVPGEHGTIDNDSPIKTDPDGVVPELPTVTPDDGYEFDHWEDQNGNPVKPGDTLNDDATLKPVFREDGSHTIDFVPGEHGTIDDDSPIKTDKDGVVPELSAVTPDDGYKFDHWEDQNGYPVKPGDKLDNDATLKPVFVAKVPVISFADGENGNVDDKTPIEATGNKVPALPNVTPDVGYEFDHWEDENGNPVKPGDDIDDNVTLKPTFRNDSSYAIGFVPGDHGNINDATPLRTDKNGTVPALPNVTPDDGYEFDHWEDENGNPVEEGDQITDDVTLKPVFKAGTITVTFESGYNGTISGDTFMEVASGTLWREISKPIATPTTSAVFSGWLANGVELTDDTVLERDTTIVAKFDSYFDQEDGTVTGLSDAYMGCNPLPSTLIVPETIDGETITSIAKSAFKTANGTNINTDHIQHISIPDTVTDIAEWTCLGMKGLVSARLSSSLDVIPRGIFANCEALKSVDNITEGIACIEMQAFRWCSSLESINIPSTVTSIGTDAFMVCSKLTSVKLPDALEEIGSNSFSSTALKSIVIPEKTLTIGKNAFSNCESLTKAQLPTKIVNIPDNMFAHCKNLSSVNFPATIRTIGEGAFSYTALPSVTIKDGCKQIGDGAFIYCSQLMSATIGEGITKTGDQVGLFQGCSNLYSVTLPSTLSSIHSATFVYCPNLKYITIKKSAGSINTDNFPWGGPSSPYPKISWTG